MSSINYERNEILCGLECQRKIDEYDLRIKIERVRLEVKKRFISNRIE
jgi:hypothetical protein